MCVNFLKRHLVCTLLVLICTLSGCVGHQAGETEPTAYRVVCSIHITHRNGSAAQEYRYEDQEKMQQILDYLRWIDPYGTPAEDPEEQRGEEFLIELHYSDGTTKTYHQRCDRYLRVGEKPWKKIAPERGRELRELLESLNREGTISSASDTGPNLPLLHPKLKWA